MAKKARKSRIRRVDIPEGGDERVLEPSQPRTTPERLPARECDALAALARKAQTARVRPNSTPAVTSRAERDAKPLTASRPPSLSVRLAAASSSNDIDPDESHTKSLDVFFVPDRSDDANAPAEWRLTVTEKRSLPHPSTEGMFGPTFDETVDVTGRLFKLKWYKSDAGIPVTRAILDRAEAWMRTDGSLATFRDTEEIYDEWQNESEEGNESS